MAPGAILSQIARMALVFHRHFWSPSGNESNQYRRLCLCFPRNGRSSRQFPVTVRLQNPFRSPFSGYNFQHLFLPPDVPLRAEAA
jgi:hypothetical protein